MCDKALLENGGTLKSVTNGYKNQELFNKIVNYPHALKFVPECYTFQKTCHKSVNIYPSTTKFVTECFMTQEMSDKAVNRCFLYLIVFPMGLKRKKF